MEVGAASCACCLAKLGLLSWGLLGIRAGAARASQGQEAEMKKSLGPRGYIEDEKAQSGRKEDMWIAWE